MADPHVITALRRKYSELMGQIERHERDAHRIRADLAHVEATIRMFKYDVDGISGTRPYTHSRWGSNGAGIRAALSILKETDRPLSAHEITLEAMRRAQMPTDDGIAVKAVASSLRGSLKRRVGRGVVMVDGFPVRWALKP